MLTFIIFLFTFANSKSNLLNKSEQQQDINQYNNNSTTPVPTEMPSDSPKIQDRSKVPTIVGILFLIFFTAFLVIFFWLNRARNDTEYSHGLSQSSLMET